MNSNDRAVFAQLRFGFLVSRATNTLPQSAAGNIFTVTGGRIALLNLLGTVTTVIQTQANNTKIQAVATTGGTTDLCAVLDVTAKIVGSSFGITGLPSDALVNGASVRAPYQVPVIPAGAIALNCAASNTGSVAWDLWYLPLDVGASVVAA